MSHETAEVVAETVTEYKVLYRAADKDGVVKDRAKAFKRESAARRFAADPQNDAYEFVKAVTTIERLGE